MTDQHTRRRFLAAAATVPLVTGCSALGGSGDGGSGRTVAMTDDLVFDPDSLTVSAGATVTWTTEGTVPHTVTAIADRIPQGATYFASGGFDTERAARNGLSAGLVEAGESYQHTFGDRPGTYRYVCLPHEGSGMTGRVVVE